MTERLCAIGCYPQLSSDVSGFGFIGFEWKFWIREGSEGAKKTPSRPHRYHSANRLVALCLSSSIDSPRLSFPSQKSPQSAAENLDLSHRIAWQRIAYWRETAEPHSHIEALRRGEIRHAQLWLASRSVQKSFIREILWAHNEGKIRNSRLKNGI